ncbi:MAG: hypothetical protein DRP80_04980 [Candidatus Omnitrophota bacterium]|nr:MAG: hypothetical protein DRP80_04980 [Candidatus Omnitrophota bacterium]
MFKNKIFLNILLIFACFLVYFNSLKGEFIWDDKISILENDYIHSLKYLPKFFSSPFFSLGSKGIRKGQSDYFRPLVLLSFSWDYFLWKDNPGGFHLTNLIFHLLNILLLFVLIFKLFKDYLLSWGVAFVYGVIPVNSSTVSYISNRPNLLLVFFLLLSFIFYLKKGYLVSLLFFSLGLLSKEVALVFPFLLFLYDYLAGRNFKRVLLKLIPFFLLILFYLLLRSKIFSLWGIEEVCVFCKMGERVLVFFASFFNYIRVLLFPVGLHFERLISVEDSFFALEFLGGVFLFFYLLYLGFYFHKKKFLYSWGVFWFILGVLPTSQIVPLMVDDKYLASEHFLYFPQIGLLIFVLAYLKEKLGRAFLKLLLPVIFIFSLLTVYYNQVQWQREEDFIRYNLKFRKTSRLYNNLGRIYERRKDLKKAQEFYQEAVKINPHYFKARYNLATLLAKKGDFLSAEAEYLKLLRIYPEFSGIYNNLGVIKLREGKLSEAKEYFEKAVRLSTQDSNPYCNLGLVLEKQGKIYQARRYYFQGLEVNPQDLDCLNQLAFSYVKEKNLDKALIYFEKVLSLDEDNSSALQNVGNIYFMKKDYSKALNYYQRALKLDPANKSLRDNLKIVKEILKKWRN